MRPAASVVLEALLLGIRVELQGYVLQWEAGALFIVGERSTTNAPDVRTEVLLPTSAVDLPTLVRWSDELPRDDLYNIVVKIQRKKDHDAKVARTEMWWAEYKARQYGVL